MIRVDRSQCRWKADTFWSVWFPGASVAVASTYLVYTPISRNSCPGSIRLWAKAGTLSPSMDELIYSRKRRKSMEEDTKLPKSYLAFLRTFTIVLDYGELALFQKCQKAWRFSKCCRMKIAKYIWNWQWKVNQRLKSMYLND